MLLFNQQTTNLTGHKSSICVHKLRSSDLRLCSWDAHARQQPLMADRAVATEIAWHGSHHGPEDPDAVKTNMSHEVMPLALLQIVFD